MENLFIGTAKDFISAKLKNVKIDMKNMVRGTWSNQTSKKVKAGYETCNLFIG